MTLRFSFHQRSGCTSPISRACQRVGTIATLPLLQLKNQILSLFRLECRRGNEKSGSIDRKFFLSFSPSSPLPVCLPSFLLPYPPTRSRFISFTKSSRQDRFLFQLTLLIPTISDSTKTLSVPKQPVPSRRGTDSRFHSSRGLSSEQRSLGPILFRIKSQILQIKIQSFFFSCLSHPLNF